MTTDQQATARERIREVLDYASRTRAEMILHGDEHTDSIIAIVREALLSEEAVESAARYSYEADDPGLPSWDYVDDDYRPKFLARARDEISSWLDTAFGEEAE